MADSAGCLHSPLWSLDVQHERNISALWSSADSLHRIDGREGKSLWRHQWPSIASCSLNTCLNEFWYWEKKKTCVKKESHLSFFTLTEWKIGTPLRSKLFPLSSAHLTPPPATYSLLQSCIRLCVCDKQDWGSNALAAALSSTWGPLERRPDRQVVITSGFQLHLPSAPLSLATSDRE